MPSGRCQTGQEEGEGEFQLPRGAGDRQEPIASRQAHRVGPDAGVVAVWVWIGRGVRTTEKRAQVCGGNAPPSCGLQAQIERSGLPYVQLTRHWKPSVRGGFER